MDAPYDQCISDYKYLFNENILKNQVAFITGGGSGIGFTITEILMRHGCDTIIASRNKDRVDAAAKRLEAATGRRCLPIKMDVRKPQEIIAAVDEAMRVYGKINILVNNAAGNFIAPITGLSFNAYKTVLEIDTMGTFNVSKVVYEKCLRGRGGVIVNISATLYYTGTVLQAHAGSAKAAIDALTKHMAVEWGSDQVRVVGLAPGPVAETEGMRKLGGITGSVKDYKFPEIPIQRMSSKEEMGHAVLFLASEAAPTITGHTLVADGGAWLSQSPEARSNRAKLIRPQNTKANL